MRGLSKAAAFLLSSTSATAFVIPDPNLGALDVRPSDPIVEHIPSEAQLKFVINSVEPTWGYPLLNFEVGSSEHACGESDIRLDGQKLESSWTGFSGVGEGLLEAYGDAHVLWTIQCIYTSTSSDEAGTLEKNGVQVFTLTLVDSKGRQTTPGFTISYRQAGKPLILHFEPKYILVGGDERRWQVPSLPSTTTKSSIEGFQNFPETNVGGLQDHQKTILSHMKDVKDRLKNKVKDFVGKLKTICHKQQNPISSQVGSHGEFDTMKFSPGRDETTDTLGGVHEGDDEASHDELDMDPTDNSVLPASPVGQAKAAATRSLDDAKSTNTGFELPSHSGVPSVQVLRIFFIGLSFFAFSIWIWLWHRDPRRRADRAARQEERRTKRLYRRAAREQKVKNFFRNMRTKYCLLYYKVITRNEKGGIDEQEDITEDVMKDDIRALCNAHRVVSSMTRTHSAAEEGHAGYREIEGSRLRSSRSVSTLPGYESEGAGPPGYTSEFNSDSSVVSTSPRISLSSGGEYEEKVEYINLNGGRAVDAPC